MATAPRINVMSGLLGNAESPRRPNEPNIRNESWRSKWYPNKTINEMKAIQQTRQGNAMARGAFLFIRMQPQTKSIILDVLKRNPLLIGEVVRGYMGGYSSADIRAVVRYLALNRDAILADPRLQGGRSRKAKKMRRRNHKTRRQAK